MAKFKEGNNMGRKFTTTRQPKHRRKVSRMTQLIKALELNDPVKHFTHNDIIKLLAYCITCNKAELEYMARNIDLPIIVLTQIKAIVSDMQNGDTKTVDKLLDRIFGKIADKTEITGADGKPLIPNTPMSRKDYEILLKKLQGEI